MNSLRVAVLVLLLSGCTSEPARPQLDTEVTRLSAGRHEAMVQTPSGEVILYTIFVPEGLERADASVPLVVAAHFGGQVFPWLGGVYADLLVVPALRDLGAVIVAPDASVSGWSEADAARIMWLAQEVKRAYPIDPRRVAMTGYSAGGAQTWLVANRNQDFFTAAIPMSARPRAGEQPWRIPVLVIHSTADELTSHATVQTFVETQNAAGAAMRLQSVQGISHHQTPAFVPALREAIPWLQEVWR